MTAPIKPWSPALNLAVLLRLIAEYWAAQLRTHRESGYHGRFYLGQRVRITVDTLDIFPGALHVPAGTLGTIAMPLDEWGDYAVIVDTDPARRRRPYGDSELTPVD
ncbi:hypothetical protein ACFY7Y_14715 [Streptomyces virginiae]|uniref:hypothetical protein n=1 Tax=Streptomyces virginiae TaxID=1961 RepID=UPI0036C05E83